jgi:predicted dehydrogenase
MCETRLANIETEDTAVAVIRFASGALGAIEATTAARPQNIEASLSLIGEGGAVELRGMNVDTIHSWRFDKSEPGDDTVLHSFGANPAGQQSYAHAAYLDDVFESVREGRDGGVGGRQAMQSLRLIHALYQSDQLKRPISLETSEFGYSRLGRKVNHPVTSDA